jgi:hypothetical protein
MADALKTFREGEDILASETNDNNQYLLSKLSDNAAQVQNYVEGEIATIKSNVSSVQATLQNNINDLDAKKPIYIVEVIENGYEGSILYSNNYCEQWGRPSINQDSTITVILKKPYKNNQYNISAVMNGGANSLSRGSFSINSVNNSKFNIYNGQDTSGSVFWCTKGFVEGV